MAESSESGWKQILKQKFKAYDVEKSIYIASRDKSNNPEVYAKMICDSLYDGDVPENLYKLYKEAVYGEDKDVKARIHRRMYSIGNRVSVRANESVRDVDMLHAADYATMSLKELKSKMLERKEKDSSIQEKMIKTANKLKEQDKDVPPSNVQPLDELENSDGYQLPDAFGKKKSSADGVQIEKFDARGLLLKKSCVDLGGHQFTTEDHPVVPNEDDLQLDDGDVVLSDAESLNCEGFNLFEDIPEEQEKIKTYGKKTSKSGISKRDNSTKKFDDLEQKAEDKKESKKASTVQKENIFESFSEAATSRKRKAEEDAAEVKQNLNHLTKLASSAAIDYKALIRGEAASRNIDLKKYRKVVLDEMKEEEDDIEPKPVDYKSKESLFLTLEEFPNQMQHPYLASTYESWIDGEEEL